ncbi:DUF6439 family protein [Pleurocapsa sp. PCC 7319]|uniref:DUF6439 family protein n=1 Tax=Pleurocapsa sp. PCC 7319 TaxID=118161 RepID=UPI000348AD02|nr:DUF6439 family protein [Pleurocapsa sp. PCC 7319]
MFEVTPLSSSKSKVPVDLTDLELAQALVERNLIAHQDWHRLKGNRKAQAKQQLASALVFLLKDQPQEALERLNQAVGWLDGSLASPPCPDAQRRKANQK